MAARRPSALSVRDGAFCKAEEMIKRCQPSQIVLNRLD